MGEAKRAHDILVEVEEWEGEWENGKRGEKKGAKVWKRGGRVAYVQ